MRRLSLFRLLAISFILLGFCISSASAAVQNRLSGTIAGNTRVTLPNSVHGKVRLATDLGPAAADTKLEAMTLRFSLTDAQQAALDQLLLDQQNPASPRYHQWLTPAQYATQFGLSSADIAKVTAWLTSQGFTITEVANSASFVSFNGTVTQAQTAFATSIHTLSLNGERHFANVTDPALPGALAGVVSAVTGLHDFKLKSHLRTRVVSSGVDPRFTSPVSGSHYIAPGDFYTIYNETPLLNNGINGTGQSIAIMGQIDISLADVAAFRAASGLGLNVPTIKTYGTDPGGSRCPLNCTPNDDDLAESSLDVEWAGATAPAATIIFVNSPDVFTSLTSAIDNNLAPIISISYGDCEADVGTSSLNTFNQLFKMGNSFGITIVAPSGDQGATDCDSGPFATNGLAVDFPGSSPYATSMGGTMFNDGSATGATTYWNTNSASGTSNASSALSYIPETAWNEDIAGSTFSAGGGGVSNFFSKPSWQQGTGVPADGSRDVPDLALNSAANHDGYLYCVKSSCATGFTSGSLAVAGGTSFAAPSFAGILALAEQKIGTRLSNANPTIYALANNPAFYNSASSSVFHDVTSGNNNSPCTAGGPNCNKGGTIGFAAGPGYDLATGWGSVNAYNLVNAWNVVAYIPPASTSTTTVRTSANSAAAGASVIFTATVVGSGGATPTGAVQFLINNVAQGAPVTLSTVGGSTTASYTYVTSCANLGQQLISGTYSGDVNYAGSKDAGITAQGSIASSIPLQVTTGTCPDFTITAPAFPPAVTTGSPSVVVTLTPVNGFTGAILLSATAVETSSATPAFLFTPNTVTIDSTASATATLTLNNILAGLRAPAASAPRAPWYAVGSGVTIASLLFFILPRRRRLGGLLLVALSIALIGGATGCGSAKNGTVAPGSTNSQAGVYTVTIVGTSSSGNVISHYAQVQFTVQ